MDQHTGRGVWKERWAMRWIEGEVVRWTYEVDGRDGRGETEG